MKRLAVVVVVVLLATVGVVLGATRIARTGSGCLPTISLRSMANDTYAVQGGTVGPPSIIKRGKPYKLYRTDPREIASVAAARTVHGRIYATLTGENFYVGGGTPFRWERQRALAPLVAASYGPRDQYLYGVADGLWRSENGGRSWARASCGLIVDGRSAVAVSPTNPQVVYLAADAGIDDSRGPLGGVYETRDSGRSWNRWADLPGPAMDGIDPAMSAVAVDPRSPNEVVGGPYVGNVIQSHDWGSDWAFARLHGPRYPWNGEKVWSLSYGPTPSSTLWAGTTGGAFRRDSSGNWVAAGLHGRSVDVIPDARDAHVAFAVSGINGQGKPSVQRTLDGGRTWRVLPGLPTKVAGLLVAASDDSVYAWWGRVIARSTDHGNTWTRLPPLPLTASLRRACNGKVHCVSS